MNQFYELLQISLDTRTSFTNIPTEKEWESLLIESDKQGILGVAFTGVEKAVKHYGSISSAGISSDLLASWYSYTQKIEERNEELNSKSAWLQEWFSNFGIDSCILKGQANAVISNCPLRRTCGDIDIWVWKRDLPDDGRRNREEIIDWVRKRSQHDKHLLFYHHIELQPIGDIEVEAHFWPAYFFNIPRMRKFERWCTEQHLIQMNNWHSIPSGNGRISIPTYEFNLVFQLVHVMRHIFSEGIGMRHIIDYYWSVERFSASQTDDKVRLRSILHSFGLEALAGGIMWILSNALGMSADKLICPPNESIGKMLLSDIERGGNLGHADKEMMSKLELNKFNLFLWRTWRSITIMQICPSEVFWGPIYRIRQWIKQRKK